MNATIHHILQTLENKLVDASPAESLIVSMQSIDELKGYMKLYSFLSRADEILYFKVFKPRFMAHKICAETAMKNLNLYPWAEHTLEQQTFYNYYTSGQSHRDPHYFTIRQCDKLDFELEELSTINGQGYDKWVARILAGEWVRRKDF